MGHVCSNTIIGAPPTPVAPAYSRKVVIHSVLPAPIQEIVVDLYAPLASALCVCVCVCVCACVSVHVHVCVCVCVCVYVVALVVVVVVVSLYV